MTFTSVQTGSPSRELLSVLWKKHSPTTPLVTSPTISLEPQAWLDSVLPSKVAVVTLVPSHKKYAKATRFRFRLGIENQISLLAKM